MLELLIQISSLIINNIPQIFYEEIAVNFVSLYENNYL